MSAEAATLPTEQAGEAHAARLQDRVRRRRGPHARRGARLGLPLPAGNACGSPPERARTRQRQARSRLCCRDGGGLRLRDAAVSRSEWRHCGGLDPQATLPAASQRQPLIFSSLCFLPRPFFCLSSCWWGFSSATVSPAERRRHRSSRLVSGHFSSCLASGSLPCRRTAARFSLLASSTSWLRPSTPSAWPSLMRSTFRAL